MLPEGYTCPEGRTRPWGTGHAVWCAREHLSGPFGIINADDFYGRDAYMQLGKQLKEKVTAEHMCMVGFALENTLTENGSVSRGVCEIENGMLQSVTEHTKIGPDGTSAINGGEIKLPMDTLVSMNMWGFKPDIFSYLEADFIDFLKENLNSEKGEFFLPFVVDGLIRAGEKQVAVLATEDKWYGVTYKEDKEQVVSAIQALVNDGVYEL